MVLYINTINDNDNWPLFKNGIQAQVAHCSDSKTLILEIHFHIFYGRHTNTQNHSLMRGSGNLKANEASKAKNKSYKAFYGTFWT